MKQKDAFDLTKYCLAILVVAIHTELAPGVLYPWLRLAVPLFFILSSYILFAKINGVSDDYQKKVHIKRFVKRNLQLYAFWFVILLPITVLVHKEWFAAGWTGVRITVTQLLFSSTFVASWYIIGSVWAVFILYALRKVDWRILMVFFLMIYVFCCFRSGYYTISSKSRMVIKLYQHYECVFTCPVLSFPIASFWMFLGKLFADHESLKGHTKLWLIGILLSSIGLFLEWKVMVSYGARVSSDLFFFLAPLSVCIFAMIKEINISLKYAKLLRTISVIMFPLHASLARVFSYVASTRIKKNYPLINFLIIIIICHITTILILKLEKRKHFSILKYSH